MSKKNSKSALSRIFSRNASVAPLDEEASQNSQEASNTNNLIPGIHSSSSGAAKQVNQVKSDDTLLTTTSTLGNPRTPSKSSLPISFTGKVKRGFVVEGGSEIVRSIATPPRIQTSKTEANTQMQNNNNVDDGKVETGKGCPTKTDSRSGYDTHTCVKITRSNESTGENYCRICHDCPSKLALVSPCLCKGTMGLVHRSCLERWLGESGKSTCEICGYEYLLKRQPKYTGCRSFFHWLRRPLSPADTRNIVFDMACFCILTPLAAVSAWLCILGAMHYNFDPESDGELSTNRSLSQQPPSNQQEQVPAMMTAGLMGPPSRRNHYQYSNPGETNSTWTSVGLLTLTGTLLAAYFVWLVVAFRFHLQVYREWRNRNFIVTVVPISPEEQAMANALRLEEIARTRNMAHTPAQRHSPQNVNVLLGNNNDERALIYAGLDNFREVEFGYPSSSTSFEEVGSEINLDVPTIPDSETNLEAEEFEPNPPRTVNSSTN